MRNDRASQFEGRTQVIWLFPPYEPFIFWEEITSLLFTACCCIHDANKKIRENVCSGPALLALLMERVNNATFSWNWP